MILDALAYGLVAIFVVGFLLFVLADLIRAIIYIRMGRYRGAGALLILWVVAILVVLFLNWRIGILE